MEKNYGTIPKTLDLRFTKDKNMVDYKNYETLNYNEKKTMAIYQNN